MSTTAHSTPKRAAIHLMRRVRTAVLRLTIFARVPRAQYRPGVLHKRRHGRHNSGNFGSNLVLHIFWRGSLIDRFQGAPHRLARS
jgi:hypothetical protein